MSFAFKTAPQGIPAWPKIDIASSLEFLIAQSSITASISFTFLEGSLRISVSHKSSLPIALMKSPQMSRLCDMANTYT